jgi:hypothetical protein
MDTMFNMEEAHGLTPSVVNTLFITPNVSTTADGLAYYAQHGDIHTLHPHYLSSYKAAHWDVASTSVATYENEIAACKNRINTLMGTGDFGYTSWRFPYTTYGTNSMQAVSNSAFIMESSSGRGTDGIQIGNTRDNTALFPKQVLVNNVKSNSIELEIAGIYDISCTDGTDFYNQYNASTLQFKNVNFPANFIVACHYQGAGVNGSLSRGVTAQGLTEGLGQIIDAEKAANPSYANFNTLGNYINGIKSANVTA